MNVEWFDRPKADPAVVEEPDRDWAERAAGWIRRLSESLAPLSARVEHIGSTAVSDLAAKPVIDLQVAVPDVDDEDAYRRRLEGLGLILRAREPDHRFFRPPSEQPRTIHVHVCQRGSNWEREHLLFRDFLRAHPDRTETYAALKREVAARVGGDRIAYSNAKAPFIEETLRAAEKWARLTEWTNDNNEPPDERQRHVVNEVDPRTPRDDIEPLR